MKFGKIMQLWITVLMFLLSVSAYADEEGGSEPQPEAESRTVLSDPEAKKNPVRINAEIRELIPAFLKLTSEEISSLDNAVSENNHDMIRRLGHRIAGACLCYGFGDMAAISRKIESAGQEKEDMQSVRSLADELSSYMKHLDIIYEPAG